MRLYLGLIVGSLRRALRPRQDLLMENLVLRQQFAVCMRQPRRLRGRQRRYGVDRESGEKAEHATGQGSNL